jgi:hypothetical protein
MSGNPIFRRDEQLVNEARTPLCERDSSAGGRSSEALERGSGMGTCAVSLQGARSNIRAHGDATR